MKTKLVIALGMLILVSATAFSFNKAKTKVAEKEPGIQFFEGTWAEALEKSKAENKPIFLDIYATWCGPCKLLKRKTFSDEEAGKYFNENFINVELDGERGDGLMLAQKFHLNAYPSLYVVNSNGEKIAFSAGYRSPSELIDFGKSALADKK